MNQGSRIDVVPGSNGTSTVRLVVGITAALNSDLSTLSGSELHLFWIKDTQATNPTVDLCDSGAADKYETYLEYSGLTCGGAPYNFGAFSLRALVCQGGSCEKHTDVNNLQFLVTKQKLGCPEPPKWSGHDVSCPMGIRVGSGAASPAGEGASAEPAGSGPGAHLRYRAGGAGGPAWPGTAAWNVTLGRYWSHDYAERIVQDPDVKHVWLITRYATFREFTDSDNNGVYETVSPSDEKRTLTRTATGWTLTDLEGRAETFDTIGRWTGTTDRNGNAKTAQYGTDGLSLVTFPDGRTERFTYLSGRLHTIQETGVGGAPVRTWVYQWNNLDLTQIDRPDGTSWKFTYSTDPNLPGYLTRIDLLGTTPGTGRVETAWEYDSMGNVKKIWRGDPLAAGPAAVDLHTFVYDNTTLPTHTDVTEVIAKGAAPITQTSGYDIGRDPGSRKPRAAQISGGCPVCGAGPNSVFEYSDAANPLLPTAQTDGRNLRTEFTYDSRGQLTRKLEAPGNLTYQRDTSWHYSPVYPAFPTQVDVPSTAGGAARRTILKSYDGQGNLHINTIQGAESGGSFSFDTVTTFNTGGQPLTIDPPGHGTDDLTTFTYDLTRGNGFLIPLSRTDPLVGTTTFGYDGLNRRTEVTDPNQVKTVTVYDNLDRVTSVTQKGDLSNPDLATIHTYTTFGDLFQTILPEGNVIEYGYDGAGRLVSIERKPDSTTPGERTLYTLDDVGHHIKEELQHQSGGVWATDAETDFVYTTRCHLDKVIRPDGTPGGAVTEYAYDCDGNLARVWDPNHPSSNQSATATQTYAYDPLNRMSTVTQPWAGAGGGTAVTKYDYDVQDHLTQVTDAEGNATAYLYSDRDLMTHQASPVSGATDYTYDEHGELTTEMDARNVLVTRTPDALDRVTAVTYPDPTLTVTYTYDAPGAFAKGRLTGITRNGQTVPYTYDRFGRMLQDGDLTYGYDKNGNRKTITYPDNITATYGFDFADRQTSLSVKVGAAPALSLVTGATYKPFGPLASLPLGNGLTETRSYDQRYVPTDIQVTGATALHWIYGTDSVGNITGVTDTLDATDNRTYTYQDVHYFLTQGNGPWGPRAWTYDKIGNRLTETRGTATDSYIYPVNAASGHNPKLQSIALAAGGTRTYSYDAVGNTLQIVDPQQQLDLIHDTANRLATLRTEPDDKATFLSYDGRDYLRNASEDGSSCTALRTVPSYSSEGLLYRRAHYDLFAGAAAPAIDSEPIFYFAGRPVATLRMVTGGISTLTFLTTDHLGTPILATRDTGALVWKGGFEAFGADWNGAGGAGVFLRFTGEWNDAVFVNLHLDPFGWSEEVAARTVEPDQDYYYVIGTYVSEGHASPPSGQPSLPDDLDRPVIPGPPLREREGLFDAAYAQVVCDCKKGFKWIYVDPPVEPLLGCIKPCIASHESDHIRWLRKHQPDSCRGGRNIPLINENSRACSECSAYKSSIACLERSLARASKSRGTAYCQFAIREIELPKHRAKLGEECSKCR